MGELLSPVGLLFMGWLYYLARKDGTLVFKFPYDWLPEKIAGFALAEVQDIESDTPREELNDRRWKSVQKLDDILTEDLNSLRLSRLKIYDLRKAAYAKMHKASTNWKFVAASQIVDDAFKGIIEKYDRGSKRW